MMLTTEANFTVNSGYFVVNINASGQVVFFFREISPSLFKIGGTYTTTEKVKAGYNNVIIHWNAQLNKNPSDIDVYINGKKCNITYSVGGSGDAYSASINFNARKLTIGALNNNGPYLGFLNGSYKVLQYLDITGMTITDAQIKAIAEQHDARNILDFTNAAIDVDFTTNPVSDRSSPAYAITTFNGLTQTTYL